MTRSRRLKRLRKLTEFRFAYESVHKTTTYSDTRLSRGRHALEISVAHQLPVKKITQRAISHQPTRTHTHKQRGMNNNANTISMRCSCHFHKCDCGKGPPDRIYKKTNPLERKNTLIIGANLISAKYRHTLDDSTCRGCIRVCGEENSGGEYEQQRTTTGHRNAE